MTSSITPQTGNGDGGKECQRGIQRSVITHYYLGPRRGVNYYDLRVRTLYVCLFICLSVCPLAYIKKHPPKVHQILCICYVWPWLGPHLTSCISGLMMTSWFRVMDKRQESKTTRMFRLCGTGGEVCRLWLHLVMHWIGNWYNYNGFHVGLKRAC